MLSKCANPDCAESFNYFTEGKLFEFGIDPENGACVPPRQVRCPPAAREFFWLCSRCAQQMTLECSDDGELKLVRFGSERQAA